MKKLLIGLAAVVVLIVVALFALPLFIPSETVKAELISRIEEATGRDVRIDGPVSISVLPSASLSAEGIGLAGLTGDSEAFSVDSVSFGLSLLPLISGNVEINGVTIERPRIVVAFDAAGQSNWTGPAAPQPEPESIEALIDAEPAGPAVDESATEALAALQSLTISRVSIVDGTVVYRDVASGTEETIEKLNLDINMPDMIGAGTIEGDFAWQGAAQKIALTIGDRPAAQLLEQIPVDLTLSSDSGSLTAKGTALGDPALFAGTIETSGSSLRGFAGGFGVDLPDAPAFAAFSLSGPLTVDDASVLVEAFDGEVGGIALKGGMRLIYDRARPGIGLKLATGSIDTALFEAPAGEGGDGAGSNGGSDAVDLSFLGAFDANVDFSAAEVILGGATLANLGMDVQLADSILNTTIKSVEVDGAPGSATLTVDAAAQPPVIGGTVTMNGIDLVGLMALAGVDAPVTGTAGIDAKFRTSGATVADLMAGLEASGSMSLADGTLTDLGLADMVGGDPAADTIDDIDINATITSLASPVSVDGALIWRDERFAISARLDARALLEGKETEVSLNATAKRLNFGFAGIASLDGLGTGKVALSTPSLRKLLAWIGQPIGDGGGLEAFSIDGIVGLEADRFTFDKTAFTLDKSSGLGTGEIVFADKPVVKAGLAMSVLDVTPYLVASGAASDASDASGGNDGGGGGGGNTAIDFSGLTAVDADLNLRADKILADDIKIGPSALTVKLAGGKLDAKLAEMALYSGAGVGAVVVDGAAATPSLAASFKLADVSALPFLTDAIGFKRIEGVGDFSFELQAAGKTQGALMQSLAGKGAMEVHDGAIRGIDIPNLLQNLSINTLLGGSSGNDRTEFKEVGATFVIDKGILTNNDLVMAGPLFALNGAGTIDLPQQTVSYRVRPQIAGKKGQLEDFPVPVRIEGALNGPKIYPEIQGVLENPQGALDQIRDIGGGLLGQVGGDKDKKKSAKKGEEATPEQTGSVDKDKKKDKKKKNKKKDKPVDQILDLLQTQ